MIITKTTFDMTVLYPENQQILGLKYSINFALQ